MKFLHSSGLRTNLEAEIPILHHLWTEGCMCTVVSCAFEELSWFTLTTNYSFCCIHQLLTYTKTLIVSITFQIFFTCSCAINLKCLRYPLFCLHSLTCVRLYRASVIRIYVCKAYMLN